ncbi:MAG: SpoIIE family protein phosphatase [Coriobacteriia bacterium]
MITLKANRITVPSWQGAAKEFLESVDEPVLVTDSQGYVVFANAPALNRFSAHAKSLIGKHIGDRRLFGHPTAGATAEHGSDEYGVAEASFRTGLPQHGIDITTPTACGATMCFAAETVPIHTDLGSIAGLIVFYRDVTEQRAVEAEYAWARREITLARDQAESRAAQAQGINQMLQAALNVKSEEQLGRECLAVMEQLTQSEFGFIGELSPDGVLKCVAAHGLGCGDMHADDERCSQAQDAVEKLLEHVLATANPYYTNDPMDDAEGLGLSADCPSLTTFLGVPLLRRGEMVGVVALGNRTKGYDETHVRAAELLATAIDAALERKRTADRLALESSMNAMLAEIGRLFTSSLNADEVMPSVLARIGDALDATGVELLMRESESWRVLRGWGMFVDAAGLRFEIETLAEHEAVYWTRRPKWMAKRVETDTSLGQEQGAYAILPMVVRGEVIGTLDITFSEARQFDEAFGDMLSRVCFFVSKAIENARLYEAEHTIAQTLQEMLVVIPQHLPEVAFARAYESATREAGHVGGDFVDMFEVGRHAIGIVIGDVSGKGVDAAVITSLVRNTIRAHAIDGLPPGFVCEKTSTVVNRFTEVGAYVTMFFGVLDTRTGLLRYVSAGHPPALVVKAGEIVGELVTDNPIMGAFEGTQFHESQWILRPGEQLVLYTDGVSEARRPDGAEFFETAGLRMALQRHGDKSTTGLPEALMGEVLRFSEQILRDDAAILVVEATRLQAPENEPKQLELGEAVAESGSARSGASAEAAEEQSVG